MLHTVLRSMKVQGIFVFAMAFVVTLLTTQSSTAHEYPYRWYSSSATFVTSRAPTYRAVIERTATEYDTRTDLVVGSTSQYVSGNGYILYWEGNYGASGWTGRALTYNGNSQPCWDTYGGFTWTGNCGMTGTSRAHYAYVDLDMTQKAAIDATAPYIMGHEAGHVFGLTHGPCTEVSIMVEGHCSTRYSTLQPHDISFINANY